LNKKSVLPAKFLPFDVVFFDEFEVLSRDRVNGKTEQKMGKTEQKMGKTEQKMGKTEQKQKLST
jgi:hypothetical protein